ncbi:MAG: rane protein of unknown function [Candidatus Saccharibacteria bacterium]|nr:rane protein of unknown function [Candidatus Saccharibacteria bacterium]
MKVSFLEKSFIAILIVIFAGIVIHAPLSVWLGTLFPDQSLLIKSWKEILIVIAALLAITIISRRRVWRLVVGDQVCQLIAAYIVLHLVLAVVFRRGLLVTMAGLAIDLRYVVFFGLMYVAVKLLPQYRRRLLWTGVIGACVVVGFATLQLLLPVDILSHIGYNKSTIMPYLTVDKNPDFIRVNSTLRGPNPLGAYVVIVLGLITAALTYKKLDLRKRKVLILTSIFILCSVIALWISYSRSALVAGLVAISIVLLTTTAKYISRKTWIVGCLLVGVAVGGLVIGRDNSFISNVLLHENQNGGSSITSNDQHVASLAYGLDRLIHEPFGSGIGSTGSASLRSDSPLIIEDQYLFIAHEVGWLGLGLFISIFTLILYRLWKDRKDWLSLGVFAAGIGLGLIGLLQPVWVDDTVSIVWWGLAGIALAGKKGIYDRKPTK